MDLDREPESANRIVDYVLVVGCLSPIQNHIYLQLEILKNAQVNNFVRKYIHTYMWANYLKFPLLSVEKKMPFWGMIHPRVDI